MHAPIQGSSSCFQFIPSAATPSVAQRSILQPGSTYSFRCSSLHSSNSALFAQRRTNFLTQHFCCPICFHVHVQQPTYKSQVFTVKTVNSFFQRIIIRIFFSKIETIKSQDPSSPPSLLWPQIQFHTALANHPSKLWLLFRKLLRPKKNLHIIHQKVTTVSPRK
jgi:hypothetical protein